MSKYKYYICDLLQSNVTRKELGIKPFENNNLFFLQNLPDLSFSYSVSPEYSTGVFDRNLKELVYKFIFDVEIETVRTTEEVDNRLVSLYTDLAILRYNTKEDTFQLVKDNDIDKVLKEISKMNNSYEPLDLNDDDLVFESNYLSYSEDVNNIITKFESLFEENINYISLASQDTSYNIFITKKNTPEYKKYKKEIFKREKPSTGGFMYENGFNNFLNYIMYQIMNGYKIGCIIRTTITKGDITRKVENGELVMKKVYGGYIHLDDDLNKVRFVQYDAKHVLKSFTVNFMTGEEIGKAEADVIYCGEAKNDVICGFDIVDF